MVVRSMVMYEIQKKNRTNKKINLVPAVLTVKHQVLRSSCACCVNISGNCTKVAQHCWDSTIIRVLITIIVESVVDFVDGSIVGLYLQHDHNNHYHNDGHGVENVDKDVPDERSPAQAFRIFVVSIWVGILCLQCVCMSREKRAVRKAGKKGKISGSS